MINHNIHRLYNLHWLPRVLQVQIMELMAIYKTINSLKNSASDSLQVETLNGAKARAFLVKSQKLGIPSF